MKRVALLTHPGLPFDGRFYLHEMARLWRADGLDVAVARGPEALAEADLVIPHVNLTALPPAYQEALRRRPAVVNARVVDTSRRRVSRLLLRPGDGHDGPVIVKSNRNAHGLPEARLDPKGTTYVAEYLVFESAAEVGREVWDRPDLVVERFEPELEDGLFWLRTWEFFGDREAGSRYSSAHPVAKGDALTWRESLSGVPDELRRLRAELGFEYGSFDYGMADGRVFLYDVNGAPGFVASMPPDRSRDLIRTLAEGLRSFA